MPNSTAVLRAPISRRLPDPVFHRTHGTTRHILYVRAVDVPEGMPLDPNPRGQNTNRRIYRDVRASLLNELGEPNTFHLKHKGITIVADAVKPGATDDEFIVEFGNGHGIVDGGHSYLLITNERGDVPIPEDQYVKFEVLTDVPNQWLAEIAGGLNTSVQVQEMSLSALRGEFNWLQDLVKSHPFAASIAWRENEDGDFDARDLVALLYCFNIAEFPNDSDNHPVKAYSNKADVLKHYIGHLEEYQGLSSIILDILTLHDTIRRDARELHNAQGGSFGKLSFVEARERGAWSFPFTGETGQYRLTNGALLPMLAAFRWFAVAADDGIVCWRGGFENVLECWRGAAPELIRATVSAHNELGRNPNALGKSRNHWANLHNIVAKRELLAGRI